MDIVEPARRSQMMSRIRGRDTGPELAVRRAAHALGLRFRLHRRDLPGSPDLVFPGRRKVVFVHGCYWHRHPGCRLAYQPKSNVEFWNAKFERNVARDARVMADLERQGWSALIIWECESRDRATVDARLQAHLGGGTTDEA
jgi:DNA mismatch endonuclease (patch repair protein)